MSMTALFYGLLLVLAVSLVIWTLETFWLLPRRQATLIASFRSGSLVEVGGDAAAGGKKIGRSGRGRGYTASTGA